ncbi:hypothetical protein BD779DRAFT_405121 [Infundibulicybe gibba]|nr:hypothetical protein BD779DRAFT_405121 [Infundibulicybe gibba]
MRSLVLYPLVLLKLSVTLFAAPTTSSDVQTHIHSAAVAHTLSHNSTAHKPTQSHALHPPPTQHAAGPVPPHITPTRTKRPPIPAQTDPPRGGSPAGHKPIAILFEVLGGIAGVVFLALTLRCVYVYKRTPHQDRIAAIVNRHRLQREMEELERNPRPLWRPRNWEPAPPYFPPPPEYVGPANVSTVAVTEHPTRDSDSPPLPERPLPQTPLPPTPPNG